MIKINSNEVLNKSNKEIVAAMVTALPKLSLLIALGLAEMPKIGEQIMVEKSTTGYGTIEYVDLIGGYVSVRYTPYKYYKEDGSDWSWGPSESYCVKKAAKQTTTDKVMFDNMVYFEEPKTGVYDLQA